MGTAMKVRLNLEVEIHTAEEGGYWASVKGVPGCVSQGETKAEIRRNIREAIAAHFDLPEKPSTPTKRKLGKAGR